MRRHLISASAILSIAFFSVGCGALDELDKAAELMEIKPKSEKMAEAEEEGPKGLQWDNVKTLNTGQINKTFVSCRIGGASQYMQEADCRARGGRPSKI